MAVSTTFYNAGHGMMPQGNPNGVQGTSVWQIDPDTMYQANTQKTLQKNQLDWQKQKFGTLLPYLNNLMGMGQASNMPGPAAGGVQPRIGGGPLWTQQQINQNINANRAQTDQSVATQNRAMQNQVASRGFGTSSPLAQALSNQMQLGGMAQKADYGRQFQQQARQDNLRYALDVGRAQENQFASRQKEANDRRQIQANQTSSLIGALGGLIGSL